MNFELEKYLSIHKIHNKSLSLL